MPKDGGAGGRTVTNRNVARHKSRQVRRGEDMKGPQAVRENTRQSNRIQQQGTQQTVFRNFTLKRKRQGVRNSPVNPKWYFTGTYILFKDDAVAKKLGFSSRTISEGCYRLKRTQASSSFEHASALLFCRLPH